MVNTKVLLENFNPNKVTKIQLKRLNNKWRYQIHQNNLPTLNIRKKRYRKHFLPKIKSDRRANIIPFKNIIDRGEYLGLGESLNKKNIIHEHITPKYKLITYINNNYELKTATIKRGSYLDDLTERKTKTNQGYKPIFKKTRNNYKSIIGQWEDVNIKKLNTGVEVYLHIIEDSLRKFLTKIQKKFKSVKTRLTLECHFKKEGEIVKKALRSKKHKIFNLISIKEITEKMIQEILDDQNKLTFEGSGWMFHSLENFFVDKVNYKPFRGATYIPTPDYVTKGSTINIKNKDNKCFKWSCLASIYPQGKHADRLTKYQRYKWNDEGISYPVSICDIPKLEKFNNISVNVYMRTPLIGYTNHYTSKYNFEKKIDLLLISKNGKSHYILIKDFNKLMSHVTKNEKKKFFCKRCFNFKYSEEELKDHEFYCNKKESIKTILPLGGSCMKFKNFRNKQKLPFVIYADFECLTKRIYDPSGKSSIKYQNHEASSYMLYIVPRDPVDIPQKKLCYLYRGKDAAKKCLKTLYEIQLMLTDYMKKRWKKLKMTKEDKKHYKKSNTCHICDKKIIETPKNKKVRDHNHLTGKYRGPAHQDCNLNFTHWKSFIPVIFHNLTGYDSHLLVREAGNFCRENNLDISCVPRNNTKFITFKIGKLKFIDSFSFLSTSLENLVDNMRTGGSEFQHLRKNINLFKFGRSRTRINRDIPLLNRKGIYPYDYMIDFDSFEEEELPEKSAFKSALNYSEVDEKDYEHAKNVWKHFKIKNLGEYNDLYLLTDVFLLADVFEEFRNLCMKNDNLDPCCYITLPSFSWDSMLKRTKVELENISDEDMYMLLEEGIRGGVSYISHRYAKANNKYMKSYDSSKESSYITYVDANNLYGWSMVQSLPHKDFQWKKIDDINKINSMSQKDRDTYLLNYLSNDGTKGEILEVDLDYPRELHDLHNEYPLAPENMTVNHNDLSTYCQETLRKLNPKKKDKYFRNLQSQKLIPNLLDKKRYILHYRNMKFYIENGLKVKKVHKAIEFTQSKWLKPYIEFNTEKRKKAKNDFEKDFWKLKNNSVFGKSMENVRNRCNSKLYVKDKHIKKIEYMPNYKDHIVIKEDEMVLVQLEKDMITLDKPIYAGFSILDMSKIVMYNFHYNYMKKKYGNKCQLLFTDTDSLTYHVKTEDLYQDMLDNKEEFDLSNQPKGKFHDPTNKKVLAKMKDETAGIPIIEFVGLRSKMYSNKLENDKIKKTCKGIKKCIRNNFITHEDYLKCITENTQLMHEQRGIRSDVYHNIYSIQQKKISLSSYDDKRYLLEDGVTSYAYGSWRINK